MNLEERLLVVTTSSSNHEEEESASVNSVNLQETGSVLSSSSSSDQWIYNGTSSSSINHRVDLVFDSIRYEVNANISSSLQPSSNLQRNTIPTPKDSIFESIQFPTCFKRKSKLILDGVSGILPSGQLSAVLGPTGSGKSTLLDVLAGRKREEWTSGSIFVNGRPVARSKFKQLCGYVVQTDILQGSMTVRENIMFSARLRLNEKHITNELREKFVSNVIEDLGLTKCADSMVGNELVRGISGGEKKRANIGCELVVQPSVLFIDEPTTGLDASTSNTVVQVLRNLSQKGCTILMTIHQPRYSIFKLIDQIYLINNGKFLFHGSPSQVMPYFTSLNLVCDEFNNPADFLLDVLSSDLVPLSLSSSDQEQPVSRHAYLLQRYENSVFSHQINAQIQRVMIESLHVVEPGSYNHVDVQSQARYGVSSWRQFVILCERSILNIKRMPIILIAQIFAMIFFAFIVGGIYYRVDRDSSLRGLQNRVGSFFFIVMSMIFSNLSAIEIILKERVLFLHQRTNGYYSPGPYFLATVLTDLIPMRVFPMLIYGTIVYEMVGYQQKFENYLVFMSALITVAITSGSLMYFFSAWIGIFAIANLALSIVFVVLMVFGGLLVNLDTLPGVLQWLKDVSFFRHAYLILSVTELHGLDFKVAPFVHISGDKYLEEQGFSLDERPRSFMLMWTFTLVFSILGYIALSRLRVE